MSRRIRAVDWSTYQGRRYKAGINHVGLLFRFECGLELATESHIGPGVQVVPWEHILRAQASGKVEWVTEYEHDLAPAQREEAWLRAEGATGIPYGVGSILKYWLSVRFTGRRWIPRAGRYEHRAKTCNVHWLSVMHPFFAGIEPEHGHLTPEAIYGYFHGSPSLLAYQAAKAAGDA